MFFFTSFVFYFLLIGVRVDREHAADEDYMSQLMRYAFGKHVLLAFDQHYSYEGTVVSEHSIAYTPNQYVDKICSQVPEGRFVRSCSIHPYRADALDELRKMHAAGARLIKWLPPAMNIDPMNERCIPFYELCRELGMVILSHGGEERAVDSTQDNQELGNPLRLRLPLKHGVKIIVAHCASLGSALDLDMEEPRTKKECFDLWVRLMEEPQWVGLLYADISAITFINRIPYLKRLLTMPKLFPRLVHGSDYPLVCLPVLNLTLPLVVLGLITTEQRSLLNDIFKWNPLVFDFVLKRTVRGPNGEKFPPEMFSRRPELGV